MPGAVKKLSDIEKSLNQRKKKYYKRRNAAILYPESSVDERKVHTQADGIGYDSKAESRIDMDDALHEYNTFNKKQKTMKRYRDKTRLEKTKRDQIKDTEKYPLPHNGVLQGHELDRRNSRNKKYTHVAGNNASSSSYLSGPGEKGSALQQPGSAPSRYPSKMQSSKLSNKLADIGNRKHKEQTEQEWADASQLLEQLQRETSHKTGSNQYTASPSSPKEKENMVYSGASEINGQENKKTNDESNNTLSSNQQPDKGCGRPLNMQGILKCMVKSWEGTFQDISQGGAISWVLEQNKRWLYLIMGILLAAAFITLCIFLIRLINLLKTTAPRSSETHKTIRGRE